MAAPLSPARKIAQGLGIGLLSALLVSLFWLLGGFSRWETKTWDWRVTLLAKPANATDRIRLILLDQYSLDWCSTQMGITWLWPRELYGAMVTFCRNCRAKSLAIDVDFHEPSHHGVEDDRRFADALAAYGKVALAAFPGNETGQEIQWPHELPSPSFEIKGLSDWLNQSHPQKIVFPRASFPEPALARQAGLLCSVHQNPDLVDGIYRRVKPFAVFDGRVMPALGLGAYLSAYPQVSLSISGNQMIIKSPGQVPRYLPVAPSGDTILNFRGPSLTYKHYNMAEILRPAIRELNGEDFTARDREIARDLRDKYLLFGFTAPGLLDVKPTPTGFQGGVEIHAVFLDNLLSDDFITKSSKGLAIFGFCIFSTGAAILLSFFSSPRKSLPISLAFLGLPIGVAILAYYRNSWFPLVAAELSVILAVSAVMFANYIFEGRQRRFIKNAFGQYLSPQFIEQLIQHPEHLKLGGERREISIFFSDLQGFTTISEGLTPEALISLLNDYLSEMTDIIQAQGGTIDKYEGDAIIAFWNAPLDIPDHGARSVRAALECQKRLAELRPGFEDRVGKAIFMRIGLNTGPAIVGNMGGRTRFDYTMLGDAVNLAARLEGVNKQFGTYTLISKATCKLLPSGEIMARELGRVAVVGRREPVSVFEPMFIDAFETQKALLTTFGKGLQAFYAGDFASALDTFKSIEAQDRPAAAYVNHCRRLLDKPPQNWEGVLEMTSK